MASHLSKRQAASRQGPQWARQLLRSRTFAWAIAALCVSAAAFAGALVAARQVAHSDANQARASRLQEATHLATALKLEIEREEETIASAAAFLASALPKETAVTQAGAGGVQASAGGVQASSTRAVRGAAAANVQAGRTGTQASAAAVQADIAGTFVGWARALLRPQLVLQAALAGDTRLALRVRHRAGFRRAVFTAGTVRDGMQSTVVDLHDGWTVRLWTSQPDTATLSDGDAVTVLVAGCLASLLLGALVFALGTRERRAARGRGGAPGPETLYDALTGLPNRTLTLDRAEGMLARAGRQSGMLTGALLIDIDWFDDLNEKLGRAAGDELLGIVAERLKGVVRAHDTVGYLGEDKFVVLVESQARGARLDSLARRVMDALHKPVELRGFGPGIHLTASIGLAFGRYTSTEELLRDAQLALEEAKSAGKDRFTLFNANLRSRIEDRGVLEMELSAALQDGQLSLLYEPIRHLRASKTAHLMAHVRWTHPKRGEVSPEDFMPLAEETGLIVPIGRWALEEACTRAAAWNVEGHRVGLMVGVAANQARRDGFATDVRRALQQSGIEPSLLTLAIPEADVIEDIAGASARMQGIKQLGVRVAIDNFGNGYAYRSELQKLPVDFLRVHRGSLAAADDEDYRSWLLEAIVLSARDLSLDVIVADVQTGEELAALHATGCMLAEGPLIGEAATAEAISGLLAQESASPAGLAPSDDSAAAVS